MRIQGDERILYYEPPVKLQRSSGDDLHLGIIQSYRIVEMEHGFKASTTRYIYELWIKQERELEAVAEFHWHPDEEVAWPHVHVKGNSPEGALGHKHFPTARMSLEDFIRFLIRDFAVTSRLPRAQWKEILTRNKREFVASASWLYYAPLIS
jgi:hypothetical protein